MERQMDIWGKKKKIYSFSVSLASKLNIWRGEKAQGSLDGRTSWFMTALATTFCIYLERWEWHGSSCSFLILGLILRGDLNATGKAQHFHLTLEMDNAYPGSYFPLDSKLFTLFFSPLLAWIHIGEENTFQSRHMYPKNLNSLSSQILFKSVQ